MSKALHCTFVGGLDDCPEAPVPGVRGGISPIGIGRDVGHNITRKWG